MRTCSDTTLGDIAAALMRLDSLLVQPSIFKRGNFREIRSTVQAALRDLGEGERSTDYYLTRATDIYKALREGWWLIPHGRLEAKIGHALASLFSAIARALQEESGQ